MMDNLISYYGFSRMPFGRDLAPGMLHRHTAHNEAVARIGWCVADRRIGVITGEVGAGFSLLISFPRMSHSVQIWAECCVVVGVHGRAGGVIRCSGPDATSCGRRLMVSVRTRCPPVVAARWPGPCVGRGWHKRR